MCIMEATSRGKEKVEDIQTGQGTNQTLRRPKNFSLQRRSNAYYFSDNSANGILKRVPFKNGSYRFDEVETVLEKPDDNAKNRNEIWTDVPLSDPESSKEEKSNTAATNDDSHEAIHNEQKNETVLKSADETTRIKLLSHGLKNLAILKAYKDYPKSKIDDKKQVKVQDQGQKEDGFYKSFQGPKAKKYQTNISVPIHLGKLKTRVSDEKYEKLSASNARSGSSEMSDEPKDGCLNADELNMMQMKTPTTEL